MSYTSFVNFDPRAGVREIVEQQIDQFVGSVGATAHCRAVIQRKGHGFYFSLVLRANGGIYDTGEFVSIDRCMNKERTWQIGVVQSLIMDIRGQMRKWSISP